MHGRLLDRLELRDVEWRIVERTVIHDWDKTERIEHLAKWDGVFARGTRGPADPVCSFLARAATD
jgi:hypothetical protein